MLLSTSSFILEAQDTQKRVVTSEQKNLSFTTIGFYDGACVMPYSVGGRAV